MTFGGTIFTTVRTDGATVNGSCCSPLKEVPILDEVFPLLLLNTSECQTSNFLGMILSFWHMSDITELLFLISTNNSAASGRSWLLKRMVGPSEAMPAALIQTIFDTA